MSLDLLEAIPLYKQAAEQQYGVVLTTNDVREAQRMADGTVCVEDHDGLHDCVMGCWEMFLHHRRAPSSNGRLNGDYI
ncbi:MAG: hypothetical protein KKG59_07305 [Nanoarchaeota archaeon]|nr:hypothetical protein [Nanoarchaeota archaeon]